MLGIRRGLACRPAAGGNGLLTGLEGYWRMNEASGNALDAVAGCTLTDVGGVGSAAGKVYAGARSFDGATQYLSRAATVPAALQMGNTTWTFASWLNCSAWPTSSPYDLHEVWANGGLWNGGALMGVNAQQLLYGYFYRANGGSVVIHSSGGLAALDTWYLVGFAWDPAQDKGMVRLGAGSWELSDALTSRVGNLGDALYCGAKSGPSYFFQGLLGPKAHWSRILSEADWALIYNAGAGLPYESFTA
jgi:hypothetical protein